MTLTLGKCYQADSERKRIYIVNPYFDIPELYQEENGKKNFNEKLIIELVSYYFQHKETIDQLAKREFFKSYSPTGFLDRDDSLYRPLYKAILFHKTYSQKFDDDILLGAEYITHWIDVDMSGKVTNDDLLNIAEGLVKKYASASLVITSMIHAGLPCLATETPVVFISNDAIVAEHSTFNTPGRLDGLIDLFRVLNLRNGHFSTDDEVLASIERFTIDTTFENKPDWRIYAERLDRQATEFMSD
jgi:hypothetical protein